MLELTCYWNASIQLWVLFIQDEDGYQIGDCDYYPHREALAHAIKTH